MRAFNTFKTLVVVAALLLIAGSGYAQWNTDGANRISYPGIVGIGGTSLPGYTLGITSTNPVFALYAQGTTNAAYATFVNTGGGAYFGQENSTGTAILNAGGLPYALVFQAAGFNSAVQFSTAGNARMTVSNSGNVGIGTTSPASKLDVTGNINVTGNATVSGNIAAKYQDVAEWVPATENLEPGTVVVLDPTASNRVMPSHQPYDTTVAGVVSGQPGVILGEQTEKSEKIATTGRVKVRVDATEAPIRVGDLLVSSGKSGFAMRSNPVDLGGVKMHRPGTIIGKALEPLPKGEGEILVLLSLQ